MRPTSLTRNAGEGNDSVEVDGFETRVFQLLPSPAGERGYEGLAKLQQSLAEVGEGKFYAQI